MSSISSIDTAAYTNLIESLQNSPSRGSVQPIPSGRGDNSNVVNEPVDLSNYYANIESSDLLKEIGENVVRSSQDLDNAMVSALENGMSVEGACNINACLHAYQANANLLSQVAKTTFEIKI